MFGNTPEPEEIKVIITTFLQFVREIAPEIESGQQVLAERLESFAEMIHGGRLRSIPRTYEVYKTYCDMGFTEDQAFVLLLNNRVALEKKIDELMSKTNKKTTP